MVTQKGHDMFMQIAELAIEDFDSVMPTIMAAEDSWRTATRGRQTTRQERLFRDRDTPGRYLAVSEFASHESAMRNSDLAETSALAGTIGELVDIRAYWNLDLVIDIRAEELASMADALVELFVSGLVDSERFSDQLLVDVNVPEWRLQVKGRDAVEGWLRSTIGEGTSVESSHWSQAGDILVLEIVTRNREPNGATARQLCVARHEGGLIEAVVVYCTGLWDRDLQARHEAEANLITSDLVWID